jgi:hypothetical protein
MSNDDFFSSISFASARTASLDEVMSTEIRDLTSRGKQKKTSSYKEGLRVYAHTNNGLVVPNTLPMSGTKGTIVKVKTAHGDVTSYDGGVFVQWDGGTKIDKVSPQFLRVAAMKVSSLDDFIVLSSPSLMITAAADKSGELVHIATKDLWSVKVAPDGAYDIERLFDENGDPLKI